MNFEPGFEWDTDKDRANQAKHGISFEEVLPIFDGPALTKIDDRKDYGEVRRLTTGILLPDIVLVVACTNRGGKVQLISARKANRQERQAFYDHLVKAFEGN